MANDTGVGDLIISVGADLTGLEEALEQIPQLAERAAQQLNAAFSGSGNADEISTAFSGGAASAQALSGAAQELEQVLSQVGGSVALTSTAIEDFGTLTRTAEDSFSTLGGSVAATGESIAGISGDLGTADEALSSLSGSLDESASAAADAVPDFEALAPAVEGIGAADSAGIDGLASSIEEAGTAAGDAGPEIEGLATAAESIAGTGDENLGALAESITEAGNAASQAGPDIEALQPAIESIGSAGDESLGVLAENLQSVGEAAATAAPNLAGLEEPLQTIGSVGDESLAALSESLHSAGEAASSAVPEVESIETALVGIGNVGAGDLAEISQGIVEAGQAASVSAGQLDEIAPALESMASVSDESLLGIAAGLEEAGSSASDAAGQIGDLDPAMEGVGEAAQQAGAALDDMQPSLEKTESGSQEAESAIGEMAEGLVQLGEALVVTEALKDFGEEALTAAANEQQAVIALTAMDGSAEQAKETIEGLEEIATSDALSMPNLIQAQQRMQALGISTAQIPGLINAAAAASDVMGTSFGRTVNMMDKMVASGTASIAMLARMGISATALAAAVNQVTGQTDADINNIAASFKQLDQSQRVQALEVAMQGLGNIVQQEAQGINGQLTILSTQWEITMKDIGNVMLPAEQAFLSFANVVLQGVQQLAVGFAQLPAPVQDVTLVVAGLAAVLIPAGLAIAAVSTALTSLSAAPLVGPMFAAIGVAVTALTEAIVAFVTVSIPAVITGLGEAAAAFLGLDIAMAPVTLTLLGVGVVLGSLYVIYENLKGGIDNLTGATQSNTEAVRAHQSAVEGDTATSVENKAAIDSNTGSTGALSAAKSVLAVATGNVTQAAKASTVVLLSEANALQQVEQAAKDVQTNMGNATKVFSDTLILFAQGQATASQYTAALDALNKSQLAANNGFQVASTALLLVENSYRQLNITAANTVVDFQQTQVAMSQGQATLSQYTSALTAMNKAQMDANNGIELLGTAVLLEANNFKQLQVAATNASTNLQAIAQDVANGTSSFVQYDAALKQLNTDQMTVNGGLQDSHTALLLAAADYQQLQINLENAATWVNAVTTDFNNQKATIQQVTAALNAQQTAYEALNNGIASFDVAVKQAAAELASQQTAFQNATIAVQAALKVYNDTGQGVENLIKAINNLTTAQQTASNGVLSWAQASAQLMANQTAQNLALTNANTMLAQAKTLLDNGSISIGVYNAALAKQKQAQDAVNGSTQTGATSSQSLAGALPAVATGYQNVATAALVANGGMISSYQDTINISNAFGNLQVNLQNATTHLNDVLQAVQNNTASYPQLQQAIAAVTQAQNALVGANGQFITQSSAVVQSLVAISQQAVQTAQSIADVVTQLNDMSSTSFSLADTLAGTVGGGGSGTVNPGGILTQTINGVSTNIMTTPGTLGGFGKFADAVSAAAAALASTSSTSLTSAATATAQTFTAVLTPTSEALAAAAAAAAQSTSAAATTVTAAATAATAAAAASTTAATLAINSTVLTSALVATVAQAAATITGAANGSNALTSASTLLLAPNSQLVTGSTLGPNGANTFVPLNTEAYDGGIAPQAPNINITIQAGTVVGQNGMQQLSTMLANQLVSTMQTQGIRLSRA